MEDVPYALIEEEPEASFSYVISGLLICFLGIAVFILVI